MAKPDRFGLLALLIVKIDAVILDSLNSIRVELNNEALILEMVAEVFLISIIGIY
jgi:hypothetical protein